MSASDSFDFIVEPGGGLFGTVRVPGDKSVSHRAVMLGSLAEGETRVEGFLEAADTLGTVAAFRAMGVEIDGPIDGSMVIRGRGLRGLLAPTEAIDLGNSGTAMRLLAGVLAGQEFSTRLVGDESLTRRPMRRVTAPLESMGAVVETTAQGTPPLHVHGRDGPLRAIRYRSPVASAQIKSCVLLAGLYAQGTTCVSEPAASRDHTERMLEAFGARVSTRDGDPCVVGGHALHGIELMVPHDISSAAFFMLGALIGEDCDVMLPGVGVNPTRTGIIDILSSMGGDIEVIPRASSGGEPLADIRVRSSRLRGIDVPPTLVPSAIDEFPAIFVAAACAEGVTRVTGAGELRVKESDRIGAMAEGLRRLGIEASPAEDGMSVVGGSIRGGQIDSRGDHRIAMAFCMAGLRAAESVRVTDCGNVVTSFPSFAGLAAAAGLTIRPAPSVAAR